MKRKAFDVFFVSLFCAAVLFIGTAIILKTPSVFSQKENRPLSARPKLSYEALIDGSYFEALGDFYKDQLPFRDSLTGLHSLCELSLGKAEVGGTVPTADGKLIALPTYVNTDMIKTNLEAIYGISEDNGAYIYIPPRSMDVFGESLPDIYDRTGADLPLSYLREDIRRMFNEFVSNAHGSSLYYATDHHWTTEGAYLAYTQICDMLDIAPYEDELFDVQTVSEEFYGTSFSSSALPYSSVTPDSVTLYRYSEDDSVIIHDRETGEVRYGFYDLEALDEKDKYSVFLGGNYPHLSISSGQEKKKLLLIKDSFANSLVPFLSLHYDIEMLDPRYCSPSLLREHLQNDDYDDILFVLSLDTLEAIKIRP